ncbi:hypothetical protein N752_15050 [Desulforamulus aquiferis]|nr:hypothetical protein N752_15050 [Desulforamulus aquiferis]
MSDIQKLVALTTITLFVPCIASVMVIFKERGWREGLVMWLSIMVVAFAIGGIINQLLKLFIDFVPFASPITMLAGVILLFLALILGWSWEKPEPKIFKSM